MLSLQYTSKFKKDFKRIKKQGKDITKLIYVLKTLCNEQQLPENMHDHLLSGQYKGHRECHIEPDWLLIYRIQETELILVAVGTGSHSELFDL